MAGNIPKMIMLALALIKALDLKNGESLKIARDIMYLWREFYIKTRLEVIRKEFIVEFKYKDNTIVSCRVDYLSTLRKLVATVKDKFRDKEK